MLDDRRGHPVPIGGAIEKESRGRRRSRWALILFYGVAGVAHLALAPTFEKIVPRWVPAAHWVVIATGLAELAGAIGLATPSLRRAAGWSLAAYALCVWPANFVHAAHDLGTGTGLGRWYHYPRLALQPAIIAWALWAGGILSRRRPER